MTKINKDQVKDLAIYDHHVADTANIVWPKINKVGAIPTDVGAEWPLTFESPLIRTGNTITFDVVANPLVNYPIIVSLGGTGLTSVTAGRLLFGKDTTTLDTSANLTFISDIFTLTGAADINGASATPLVRIQNNTEDALDLFGYTGIGSTYLLLANGVGPGTPFDTVDPTSVIFSSTYGNIVLANKDWAGFESLAFGGSSLSFPAIFTDGAKLRLKLADNSAYTDLKLKNLDTTGGIIIGEDLDAGRSADFLPAHDYATNIGSPVKKFLSIYAAELNVDTIVAQDVISTIGGRILVGPTTYLEEPMAASDTTITVKHNQMIVDDIVYMEGHMHVEFMQIVTGPTGADPGPYTYTVTRNIDGTGANDWLKGDAIFNTGQATNGFIDLYALRGLKYTVSGTDPIYTQAGPTIVGNVRNSLTFNDWTEHYALGNLRGIYGYNADIYGIALGEYSDTTAYLTLDGDPTTGGIKFYGNTAVSSVPRIWLKNDGSGYLANTNIIWDTNGNAKIAGWSIDSTSIYSGGIHLVSNNTAVNNKMYIGVSGTYNTADTPFYVDGSGKFSLGQKLIWDGATLTVDGGITVVSDWNSLLNKPVSLADINALEGSKLSGVESGATLGADWSANLYNIPSTLATPASSGLFLSSTHLGYYDFGASLWKTFMDNSGDFYLGGTSGALQWNAGSNTLYIKGQIEVVAGGSNTAATTTQVNAAAGTADWAGITNVPTPLTTPAGSGLFISSTYMGYYSSGSFKTYIDSSGNFSLGNPTPGNVGLSWAQGSGTLSVYGNGEFSGKITATSGLIGNWTIDSTSIRNSTSTLVLSSANSSLKAKKVLPSTEVIDIVSLDPVNGLTLGYDVGVPSYSPTTSLTIRPTNSGETVITGSIWSTWSNHVVNRLYFGNPPAANSDASANTTSISNSETIIQALGNPSSAYSSGKTILRAAARGDEVKLTAYCYNEAITPFLTTGFSFTTGGNRVSPQRTCSVDMDTDLNIYTAYPYNTSIKASVKNYKTGAYQEALFVATRGDSAGASGLKLSTGTLTPATNWFMGTRPSANDLYFSNASDVVVFTFTQAGEAYATGVFHDSDLKLKTNIAALDSDKSYDIVKSLNPVSFNWKNKPEEKKNWGFIAQEVEKVISDSGENCGAVKGHADPDTGEETLAIDSSQLISVLVKTVQTLQAKIEALEKKLG